MVHSPVIASKTEMLQNMEDYPLQNQSVHNQITNRSSAKDGLNCIDRSNEDYANRDTSISTTTLL